MAVNECVVIAGLEQVRHTYADGVVGIYWGQFSKNLIPEFMVLAHEKDDGVITFYSKPWILPRSQVYRTRVDRPEDSLSERLGALDKKVDLALIDARNHRDLLSQRLDGVCSKVYKVVDDVNRNKECQSLTSNRLNNVQGDIRALEDKVAGLVRKVYDAGRILNNPPPRDTRPGSTYMPNVSGVERLTHNGGRGPHPNDTGWGPA